MITFKTKSGDWAKDRDEVIDMLNKLDGFNTPMFWNEDRSVGFTAGPAMVFTAMQMLLWLTGHPVQSVAEAIEQLRALSMARR